MLTKNKTGLVIVCLLSSISMFGQKDNEAVTTLSLGVSEVCLIKASSSVISLQLNQRDAGLSLETSTADETARLLISSVVSETPLTLIAKISDGVVPAGTKLQLTALPPNGNFKGSTGLYASPPITLDGTNQAFVTQITTCYSGTGLSDGYPLKFIFSLDDPDVSYGAIRAKNATITVTITLTEVQ